MYLLFYYWSLDPVERLAAFHKQGQSVAVKTKPALPSQPDHSNELSVLKHAEKNDSSPLMYQ